MIRFVYERFAYEPPRVVIPDVGPLARRLILGQLFIGLSNGIVTPTWFLYLDRVRGFGAQVAGASFTLRAIGMIALVPLAGWLIDRRGPRGVVLAGTMCNTIGALALAFSTRSGPALAGSLLIGAGVALTGPATRTVLLEAVSPAERRQAAAASFQMWNLGLGAGGLIGGLIADPRAPLTFTGLFIGLAALGIATRILNLPAMPKLPNATRAAAPQHAFGRALRSPSLCWYLTAAMLLQFGGYGQTTSGLPGLATTLLGVATSVVGIALAANTAVVLLSGPAARRFAYQHRSSTVLGITGLVWAAAWAMVAGATLTTSTFTISASIIAFYIIFGIGETLLAAVSTPLVATLAPAGSLGTYLGLDTLTRQIGGALGPAISGALMARHATLTYLTVAILVCGVTWPVARALRTTLADHQDHDAHTRPQRIKPTSG